MTAMTHIKEWCSSRNESIVCRPEQRIEMLAIWALRQSRSLDTADFEPPVETIENGMVWLRRAKRLR